MRALGSLPSTHTRARNAHLPARRGGGGWEQALGAAELVEHGRVLEKRGRKKSSQLKLFVTRSVLPWCILTLAWSKATCVFWGREPRCIGCVS